MYGKWLPYSIFKEWQRKNQPSFLTGIVSPNIFDPWLSNTGIWGSNMEKLHGCIYSSDCQFCLFFFSLLESPGFWFYSLILEAFYISGHSFNKIIYLPALQFMADNVKECGVHFALIGPNKSFQFFILVA